MIALYEHFPELSVHERVNFTSILSNKKFQERLMQIFLTLNQKTFTFEEIDNPTIPNTTIIFEVGLADGNSFTFIDKDEVKKVLSILRKETFNLMDFLCAIRYYRDYTSHKKPLRFDYYLTRFNFGEKIIEFLVFHERGPRYFTPQDIVEFLKDRINETSTKRILKKIETHNST